MLGTGFINSKNMTCHVKEFKVRASLDMKVPRVTRADDEKIPSDISNLPQRSLLFKSPSVKIILGLLSTRVIWLLISTRQTICN